MMELKQSEADQRQVGQSSCYCQGERRVSISRMKRCYRVESDRTNVRGRLLRPAVFSWVQFMLMAVWTQQSEGMVSMYATAIHSARTFTYTRSETNQCTESETDASCCTAYVRVCCVGV